MEENKILFKCKHCDNDDMKHMIIKTVVQANPEYRPFPNNAGVSPTLNVGLHIDCAKCEKDTIIIIDELYRNNTELPQNVPNEVLVHVKFEKPMFSAIKYILTDDMTLDKVVVDINNQKISLITQKLVTIGYKEITEEQYKALKNKMVEEVKTEVKETEIKKDDEVKIETNNIRNGGKR